MLVAVVALGVLLPASTAAAHTRTQETTNLDSRITHDPDLPGVEWTVHTGGLLIEVTNHGDDVLVVEGYEGEPYLRVGPDGKLIVETELGAVALTAPRSWEVSGERHPRDARW